ncbi:MAG: hypothetical protein VKN72_14505 [Nostocales cyanobacterium 94392]|nr:hypothetical protein [Nostocales cyanobacterium 94392]
MTQKNKYRLTVEVAFLESISVIAKNSHQNPTSHLMHPVAR